MDSLAFDPTDAFVAAGAQDGVLRIWRVADGRLVRRRALPLGEGAWPAVAWSRRVVRAVDNSGALHQLSWPHEQWARRSIDPDLIVEGAAGDTLVVRSVADPTLWLVRPGRPGRKGPIVVPAGWVLLGCVPAARGVLLRADDGRLALATPTGREPLPWVSDRDWATCAAADGDQLVLGTAGGALLLRSGSGPWTQVAASVGLVEGLALSVAGGRLAVGGANHLTILTSATGREVRTIRGPAPATDVCVHEDAVTCGFADGRVARWVPGGAAAGWVAPPVPVRPTWPRPASVSVDREHAATRHDGTLLVWRLADGRAVRRTEPIPHHGSGPVLRWPWLVFAWRGRVRSWNLETGALEERPLDVERASAVLGPGQWVSVLQARRRDFDPGPTVFLRTDHGWIGRMQADGDVRTLARLPGAWITAVDEDEAGGLALATSAPPVLFHLDPTGAHLRPLWRFAGTVNAVAISRDGARVAGASADGSVVVVDLGDGHVERLLGRGEDGS